MFQCALFVSPCFPGKAFIHHRMVMIPICLQMREPMLPVLLKLLSFHFKISFVLLLQTYASWLVSNGMLILCRIYTPSSKVTFVDCIHVGNLIPSTTPPLSIRYLVYSMACIQFTCIYLSIIWTYLIWIYADLLLPEFIWYFISTSLFIENYCIIASSFANGVWRKSW